ncbi:hypothetical protein AU467_06735 [Mesorhizobium loti]|uniref:Uncharacterized protein n=1 Tax=Rhizobium loti TaxID=381 RepID=A0A101KNR7_RHILI|nr:hypothetical protein AU467_06735 [Mesorhizobium loti]
MGKALECFTRIFNRPVSVEGFPTHFKGTITVKIGDAIPFDQKMVGVQNGSDFVRKAKTYEH